MNFNSMFESKYLKAADLEDDTTVTIEAVQIEELNGENKPVIYFKEFKQGMVLNRTNAKAISEVLKSTDTDDWANHQVTLTVMPVEFQGKTTEGIRVKMRPPRAAIAAVPTQQAQRQQVTREGVRQVLAARPQYDSDDDIPI